MPVRHTIAKEYYNIIHYHKSAIFATKNRGINTKLDLVGLLTGGSVHQTAQLTYGYYFNL